MATRFIVLLEPLHQIGAAVDVAPATSIPDRNVVLSTDALKERAQVILLDGHLDVVLLEVPQADGFIAPPARRRRTHPRLGVRHKVRPIDVFKVGWCPLLIAGTEVQRQPAILAPIADIAFKPVEILLADHALGFAQVAPATASHAEIQFDRISSMASVKAAIWPSKTACWLALRRPLRLSGKRTVGVLTPHLPSWKAAILATIATRDKEGSGSRLGQNAGLCPQR